MRLYHLNTVKADLSLARSHKDAFTGRMSFGKFCVSHLKHCTMETMRYLIPDYMVEFDVERSGEEHLVYLEQRYQTKHTEYKLGLASKSKVWKSLAAPPAPRGLT